MTQQTPPEQPRPKDRGYESPRVKAQRLSAARGNAAADPPESPRVRIQRESAAKPR